MENERLIKNPSNGLAHTRRPRGEEEDIEWGAEEGERERERKAPALFMLERAMQRGLSRMDGQDLLGRVGLVGR